MHHTLYLLRFPSQITFCRIGPLSIFCRCCFLGCVVGPTFGRWWLPRISSELGGVWGRRLLPMQWFPFITFWVQLVNFWEGCFRSWTLFKWDLLLCSFVLIFHFVIISTYIRGTLFPQFLDFILFRPPKRCIIISHSQKIFQICFTISVESSITFLNLVQAVLN